MTFGGSDVMKLVISARDNTRGAFAKIGTQIKGIKGHTGGLNTGFKGLKGTMENLSGAAGKLAGALGPLGIAGVAVAAAAAVGMFAASAVNSFTAFEDSMANVRKTTGMTKEETTALGGAIDGMALRLPLAHGELTKIAAIAGQLGIQGKTSILGFTEDIAKMATAFDMFADDTATAMAKMANIYGIPLEQISNMGSAINTLGNTTAASESQLMDFGMSLGPTGKQLGFTFEQTMALGASMIEMGVNSSDAGTRLNRAFSKIGQNIDEVAKFMGVSSDEFRNSFENMPMETFTEILQKLSAVEGNLKANTIGAELFGEVGAKSIKAIIGNLDGLGTNLSTVTTGFKENTSLTEEFAAKTDTLKAKFALVGNAAESLKINIGQALAPMAGLLAEGVTKGISGISKAFTGMQKVAGPVLDLLFIQFHALKAFLDGLFTPIIQALSPLSGLFEGTGAAVGKLNVVLNIMKDVFTIITGVAKMLGSILGTLLANAITPLVAKIKEGIATLTEFYGKLGPIKGLIEGIKDTVGVGTAAIGEWANSFEETTPAADGLTEAIQELAEGSEKTAGSFKEAVPAADGLKEAIQELTEGSEKTALALSKSFKTLGSRLTEASGSYKAAISDISKEIDTLKDAWNLASDDQKEAIGKQIEALVGVKEELERGEEEADKYFDTHKKGAEEATEKQEEFTVKLGETTVTFKGMAAEVVKNADAYADLQKNAETLLDLDWSVFAKLEAELPNIDTGIGDMSSAFVGLKGILEENIGELEAVKTSVIDIAEIAAPFLEEGFLNGIKSIGSFAGALSDAGSAINTFSNLQEVSVDGCINFSLHVNDMVSALQVLDNQMEDLVPSFAKMDSLISNIADAFLYSGGKGEAFQEDISTIINSAIIDLKSQGITIEELTSKYDEYVKNGMKSNEAFSHSLHDVGVDSRESVMAVFDVLEKVGGSAETYGYGFSDAFVTILKAGEDLDDWSNKYLHTSSTVTYQMDKQTGALKNQTDQLAKITDALQPYLNFMRTLNELAALSALSTEELNNGLNSIKDTLVNLSTALSTFDLAPVMESLFGSGEEGEGTAKKFTDTMLANASKFDTLIVYIERLSIAITTLTGAFTALEDINKSVLVDETALIELFGSITGIMENFTSAMDKSGFGDKLAAGIEKMVVSAAPLTTCFKDNNAAVTQFNNTLSAFKSVLGGVVDTIDRLLEMTTMAVPEVDDLAAAFNKASEFIEVFNKALMKHINTNKGAWTVNAEFEKHIDKLGDAMSIYNRAFNMFDKLTSNVMSLSKAFEELKDATIISSIDMDKAIQNIDVFVNRFVEALRLNLDNLVDSLVDINAEWTKHAEKMKVVMPSYETATKDIGTLISSITSLGGALLSLSEMGIITSAKFDSGFSALITSVANFSKSLRNNVLPLIDSLQLLRNAWMENEAVLVPLMVNFVTITKNFASLAYHANQMTASFTQLAENSGSLEKGFDSLISFINKVVESTKEFYTPAVARAIALYIIDIGKVIYAFRYLSEQLKTATNNVENEVTITVNNIAKSILSLKSLIPSMFTYGAGMMFSFISGINAWIPVLEAQLIGIANMIKAYLGVSSPTELGALKDIEKWPKNLVKTFTSGIKNEMGTLNASFGGMRLAAPGGGDRSNGGNTTYITFKVEQKITDVASAKVATTELERMLSRHEML